MNSDAVTAAIVTFVWVFAAIVIVGDRWVARAKS